ncbi:MAG: MarR family winged helix-turn-helix transcriptional regulator [Burkholderiaceae bacterium]
MLVDERLRHARTFLGRQAGLTGPQYMMLMSVAYLQGKTGIAVSALAKELRVTSAFITGQSRRLIESGLLAKKPNPLDSRSVLLSVTLAGRRRIEVLVPEVRTVNDLFFGRVSAASFRNALRFLDELIDGSGLAISFISHREGRHLGRR